LVLPLILLATAAQYAPLALGLLGRYLDGFCGSFSRCQE
jgi:hypothetical protein